MKIGQNTWETSSTLCTVERQWYHEDSDNQQQPTDLVERQQKGTPTRRTRRRTITQEKREENGMWGSNLLHTQPRLFFILDLIGRV